MDDDGRIPIDECVEAKQRHAHYFHDRRTSDIWRSRVEHGAHSREATRCGDTYCIYGEICVSLDSTQDVSLDRRGSFLRVEEQSDSIHRHQASSRERDDSERLVERNDGFQPATLESDGRISKRYVESLFLRLVQSPGKLVSYALCA